MAMCTQSISFCGIGGRRMMTSGASSAQTQA